MRAFLAGIGLALAAAVVAVPGRAAEEVRGAGEVRAAAKARGSVRVIATLNQAAPGARVASPASLLRGRLAAAGVSEVDPLGSLPALAVELDLRQLEALLASGLVQGVRLDQRMRPGLKQSTAIVGAPAVWSQGAAGAGQVVAVLDTGVDGAHPFLRGKVVSEACFSEEYAPESATSLCGQARASSTGKGTAAPCARTVQDCEHGTHVAGIVAGKNARLSGVAPAAKLIAVQVYSLIRDRSYCGSADTCVAAYESAIIAALDHVSALAGTYSIAAVNLSLGGLTFAGNCDGYSPEMKAAIDGLRAKGIATVIASGNDYQSGAVSFPGCISTAITVAASTDSGTERITGFSNLSPIVDLVAPGDSIESSVLGRKFASYAGTSMATPHVAGAWAALKSADPTLSVAGIEAALERTGKRLRRSGIAKPRIDLGKALTALRTAPRARAAAPTG